MQRGRRRFVHGRSKGTFPPRASRRARGRPASVGFALREHGVGDEILPGRLGLSDPVHQRRHEDHPRSGQEERVVGIARRGEHTPTAKRPSLRGTAQNWPGRSTRSSEARTRRRAGARSADCRRRPPHGAPRRSGRTVPPRRAAAVVRPDRVLRSGHDSGTRRVRARVPCRARRRDEDPSPPRNRLRRGRRLLRAARDPDSDPFVAFAAFALIALVGLVVDSCARRWGSCSGARCAAHAARVCGPETGRSRRDGSDAMRARGVEPPRARSPPGPKPGASASSATPAPSQGSVMP